MKYLLIIMLFGRCPQTTTIEYQTLGYCTAAMEALQKDFDEKHIDASLSCLLVGQ